MREYVQAETAELKARCDRLEAEVVALKATVMAMGRRLGLPSGG